MNRKIPIKLQAAHSAFEKAREALGAFRAANPKLVEQYERHIQAYNDALDEVKSLYRDNADRVGETFNDFSARRKTEIDGKLLVDLLGDTGLLFVELRYAVNRAEYNKGVADGTIPPDVADAVSTLGSPAVYGPKKL